MQRLMTAGRILCYSAGSFHVRTDRAPAPSPAQKQLQKKRGRAAALLLALLVVFGAVYAALYTQPALRYRGEIVPLALEEDGRRVYRSQDVSIEITQGADTTRVALQQGDGAARDFLVSEDGARVIVRDENGQMLLSGTFTGQSFYHDDGTRDEQYEGLQSKLDRLILSDDTPQSVEALFLSRSYPTAKRGGGRAGLWVFLVVVAALYVPLRLQAWSPLAPEQHNRFDCVMLEDWGKETESAAHQKISRWVLVGWGVLLVVVLALLIWDVTCY